MSPDKFEVDKVVKVLISNDGIITVPISSPTDIHSIVVSDRLYNSGKEYKLMHVIPVNRVRCDVYGAAGESIVFTLPAPKLTLPCGEEFVLPLGATVTFDDSDVPYFQNVLHNLLKVLVAGVEPVTAGSGENVTHLKRSDSTVEGCPYATFLSTRESLYEVPRFLSEVSG